MKNTLKEMTIAEAMEVAEMFQQPRSYAGTIHPFEIGQVYLIRTVTMIDTGRVVKVMPNEIVLTEAAWIADTGRFSDALKKAEFGEVEPFPDGEVIIGRGSIVDAVKIERAPRSQK